MMEVLQKYGPKFLTFVIRDASPFIHLQEPLRHRTVTIHLTQEQRERLILKATGAVGRVTHFEEVSQVIVEPDEKQEATG